MSARLGLLLAFFIVAFSCSNLVHAQLLSREDSLAVVSAARLQEFLGQDIGRMALFAYDAQSESFVPIPFQVDERVLHTFCEGTVFEFESIAYDVFGEDDGWLDANDEIAFVYGDASSRAPLDATWPSGAGEPRFEISVEDRRGSGETRWVYSFLGDGLARSSESYISWAQGATSAIHTSRFFVGYDGNWRLTEIAVKAPCGSGADLIDRVKGRARLHEDTWEDEEMWDETSDFLGGLLGPVRAIRLVRGAMSGIQTIHFDVVTPSSIRRRIDLRVHVLSAVRLYTDFLPRQGARLETALVRSGYAVDGSPDSFPPAVPSWTLYSSPDGGLAQLIVPPPDTTRYQGAEFFYVDDASHDDAISRTPDYGDDDDSAYGAQGVELIGTEDCCADPLTTLVTTRVLCANESGAALGDAFLELEEVPLRISTQPQWARLGAIRTLTVERPACELCLSWDALAGAAGYRVYKASPPRAVGSGWELEHEGNDTSYCEESPCAPGDCQAFSVVAYDDSGVEGLW